MQNDLCAVQRELRVVMENYGVSQTVISGNFTRSKNMDAQLFFQVRLLDGEFVQKGGRALGRRSNHVAGGRIDQRIRDGIIEWLAIHVGTEGRRVGRRT